MKEILENIFAVEVPGDCFGFELNNRSQLGYWENVLQGSMWKVVDLPPGSYEILFTTKDCTEQQAMKVVAWDMYEDVGILAANYMDDRTGDKKTCSDSLQSLLRSHGLDPDKNYLLLTLKK